jgi:hypothetical protein
MSSHAASFTSYKLNRLSGQLRHKGIQLVIAAEFVSQRKHGAVRSILLTEYHSKQKKKFLKPT